MKKLFAGLFIGLLTFIPLSAHAAMLESGETYSLSSGEVVEENLYAAGNVVTISGAVMADLYSAGSTVVVSGEVLEDANLAGGDVSVFGNVGEDLRAFGGTVTIDSTIGGELIVAGGMINMLNGTIVEGDAVIGGGAIIIDGVIHGDVLIGGGDVTINGIIDGDVKIDAENVTLGSGAMIDGNLEYTALEEMNMNDGAQIAGEVMFEELERVSNEWEMQPSLRGMMFPFKMGINLFKVLLTLTAALVLMLLFKKKSADITKLGAKEFGTSLLVGLVAFIVAPIAIILLMITVAGLKLAMIVAALYYLALMLAKLFGAVLVGWFTFEVLKKWFKKPTSITFGWEMIVVGVILFFLIGMIPIVGFFFKAVFILAALGAILLMFYREVWLKR